LHVVPHLFPSAKNVLALTSVAVGVFAHNRFGTTALTFANGIKNGMVLHLLRQIKNAADTLASIITINAMR